MPEQMFYNTGIGTYIWIVTNRKEKRRRDKIQLVDAREFTCPCAAVWATNAASSARQDDQPEATSVRLYARFADGDRSKVFDNKEFGYTRVTVDRPLRLKFQITDERRAAFPHAHPHEGRLGRNQPRKLSAALSKAWARPWGEIALPTQEAQGRWAAPERKSIPRTFTEDGPRGGTGGFGLGGPI